MTKNKDINISPSKGISIIIKNDIVQPTPIKPKKKRKYKRKVNTDLFQQCHHIFLLVMFHILNLNTL